MITLSGLRDEALGWSSCGCGIMALVPEALEMQVLFLVWSWADMWPWTRHVISTAEGSFM